MLGFSLKSSELILNTECVLSPIVFSVYTDNISFRSEGTTCLKYADDTVWSS